MSARILLAAWPFEGHVLPMLSVAGALRDRGSEVAFYTGERMRNVVEEAGFSVFPFRRVEEAWKPVQATERATQGQRRPLRAEQRAFRDWLVETIPAQVADLEELVERWRPDVVASDFSMWGPPLVLAETGSVPVALWCTLMGPQIPGPDAPPVWGLGLSPPRTARARAIARLLAGATDLVAAPLRRRVDELRAERGLPPLEVPVTAALGRVPLYLVPNVPELDHARRDLPACVQYVGPCLWHPPEPEGTAAWLDAIPAGRPWVHVTEGTSHYQEPFLLRAAARGLADRPLEALLTTGQGGRDPRTLDLGPSALNVHVTRWLSHSELLPRCAAVVTTGGAASVMAALRAGVPLVVVPTSWDKPDNAYRVVDAGAGVKLAPRRCTAERLRDAVEEVLGAPHYRAAAERISRRLTQIPGPAHAAALLEALVPERAPVHR